jgi:hypothetical protein
MINIMQDQKTYRRRSRSVGGSGPNRFGGAFGKKNMIGCTSNIISTMNNVPLVLRMFVILVMLTSISSRSRYITTVYGEIQQEEEGKREKDPGSSSVCQEGEGGSSTESCVNTELVRDVPGSYCRTISDLGGFDGVGVGDTSVMISPDLYRYGGSAQAYRPDTVMSSVVCSSQVGQDLRYKASSWPFTRRTTGRGGAPTMNIKLSLWSCSPTSKSDEKSVDGCTCYPVRDNSLRVEVWQARPDGTYSTLKGGCSSSSSDECRATIPVVDGGDSATTTASFSTVAPGSTGIMGGLSPWSWESSPYGRPVIHVLTDSPSHLPLLLDIPILPHPKSLERRDFSLRWLDWRGHAWSVQRQSEVNLPYEITSWTADVDKNHIDVEIDIYMESTVSHDEAKGSRGASISALFCPSFLRALTPGAFFVEPIAICRRHLLDFFPL